MKNNNSLFLFASLLILIMGCQEEVDKNDNPKEVVTNITQNAIPKFSKNKIIIHGKTDYYDSVYTLQIVDKDSIIKLEIEDLTFKVELEKETPVIVNFVTQRNRSIPIFATPGDSIYFGFKLVDVLNMRHKHQFRGDHAYENALLSQLNQYLIYDNASYNYLHDVEADVFLQRMDSLKIISKKLIKNFRNQGIQLDPLFLNYYRLFLDLRIKAFLNLYPFRYERSLQKGKPKIDEAYRERLNAPFPLDPVYLDIYAYQAALNIHMKNKSDNYFEKNDSPIESNKISLMTFELIDSVFADQKAIKDYLKFKHIEAKLRYMETLSSYQINLKEEPKKEDTPVINKTRRPSLFENRALDYFNTLELYESSNPSAYYLSIIERRTNALKLE